MATQYPRPGGITRARYRVRQFLNAATARIRPEERAAVAALLPPAALALFDRMPRDAQRHSLNVMQALQGAGVTRDRLYFERFYTEDAPRAAPSAQAEAAARHGVAVSVVLDGVTRQFDLTEAGDSIVDAAARAGLELPWSCKGGMCCTCRCKVVEGAAEMAVNYSLEPWEIEAGFTLACQSRPTSEKIVLDFDAA